MLNEIKEYELYLTKGYGGIIRKKNLQDSLAGIRSVLTLLARGFIADCKKEGIFDIAKIHLYTKTFLEVWLVGIAVASENAKTSNKTETLIEAIKEIKRYKTLSVTLKKADEAKLLRHMNHEKISQKGMSNTDVTRRKYLTSKLECWREPLFPEEKDSLNAIRFDAIVADALLQGELKNRLLRIRETEKSNHGIDGEFTGARMWAVLGIVALFLNHKPSYCQSGIISWAELSNNLKKEANSKGKNPYDSVASLVKKAGYSYKGEPLFSVYAVTQSCMKLSVNEEWLRDYEVELVPVDTVRDIRYNMYGDEDFWNPPKKTSRGSKKEYSNIHTMKKPYIMNKAEDREL